MPTHPTQQERAVLRTASWLDFRAFPSVLLAPFSLTKKRPPCAPAVAAIPDALFATLCDFVGIRAATFISADSLVPQGFHYDRLSRTGPLMTPAPPMDLHCSSKGKNTCGVCPSPVETVDKRMHPSIRRQKRAATRGERFNFCPRRTKRPFTPSRPHFFRGRIEGLFWRKSTVSVGG
jgi:hypothetical protein